MEGVGHRRTGRPWGEDSRPGGRISVGIGHRVVEATEIGHDRQRAIGHRLHLGEPARFETTRHDEQIRTGEDLMRQLCVVPVDEGDTVGQFGGCPVERIGQPGGYSRITLALERIDGDALQTVMADIYVRLPADVVPGEQRSDFLDLYTAEHAKRFVW